MSSLFCPRCGKECEELFENVCFSCLLETRQLFELPPAFEFETCKNCGRVKVSGKWLDSIELAFNAWLPKAFKSKVLEDVSLEAIVEAEKALVKISATIGGKKVSFQREIALVSKNAVCDSCMKLSSNYFEAIIQLRFSEKKLDAEKWVLEAENLLAVLHKKDPMAVLAKFQKVKGGLDLYVVSLRAGKHLAEELAKKHRVIVTTSYTTTGFDKNKEQEKRRYTFLVRL